MPVKNNAHLQALDPATYLCVLAFVCTHTHLSVHTRKLSLTSSSPQQCPCTTTYPCRCSLPCTHVPVHTCTPFQSHLQDVLPPPLLSGLQGTSCQQVVLSPGLWVCVTGAQVLGKHFSLPGALSWGLTLSPKYLSKHEGAGSYVPRLACGESGILPG